MSSHSHSELIRACYSFSNLLLALVLLRRILSRSGRGVAFFTSAILEPGDDLELGLVDASEPVALACEAVAESALRVALLLLTQLVVRLLRQPRRCWPLFWSRAAYHIGKLLRLCQLLLDCCWQGLIAFQRAAHGVWLSDSRDDAPATSIPEVGTSIVASGPY